MSLQNFSMKMKLPELNQRSYRITPSDGHSDNEYGFSNKTSQGGIYEVKPNFIARKVNNEDLYAEQKQPNILSQINEEATAEWEDGSPKNVNMFSDTKEPVNIFRDEMLNSQKFKEHNKGPTYKDGQVVKHSIVGTVELFEKAEKRIKKHSTKESMASIDKDSNSEISVTAGPNKNLRPASTRSDRGSNSFLGGGLSSHQGILGKKTNNEKKKDKDDIKATREEILNQIDKMKESQDKFYEMQQQRLKNLSKGDQLYATKEQRILDKYEENIALWERIADKTNRKIGRDPVKSVSNRLEDHRSKKEMAQILDAIKTDQERYGTVYWYMTLRKKSPKAIRPEYVQYVPEAYNTEFLEEHNNTLEVIAKPKKFSSTAIEFGRLTHFGRTGKEYVQKQLTSRDKALQKVKPTKVEDIKELIVEGTNKLTLEVDGFFKGNEKRETFIVPKQIFERGKEDKVEAIIAQNYDRQEIIRNGLGVVFK